MEIYLGVGYQRLGHAIKRTLLVVAEFQECRNHNYLLKQLIYFGPYLGGC